MNMRAIRGGALVMEGRRMREGIEDDKSGEKRQVLNNPGLFPHCN